MSKRPKTSLLWSYFTITDQATKSAKCDLCGQKLSYRGTVSNLKKHVERRHPTVNVSVLNSQKSFSTCTSSSNSDNIQGIQISSPEESSQVPPGVPVPPSESSSLTTACRPVKQQSLPSFLPVHRKISNIQKKKLDKLLLQLFTADFQPFSIVEDEGFVAFCTGLNPAYSLPDRKTISSSLIPAAYEQCMTLVRQHLLSASSVCLTTDSWTSRNSESYLAVTAHFINEDFELESVLLECSVLPHSHTSVNLAAEIKCISDKFHLSDKIVAVITDNAPNIKNAIINELQWKHFPCYAHTLNLIVHDALKVTRVLQEKVKHVVAYFKRSTTATQKLLTAQKNMGSVQPKKLIQEVPTRWNSTYYMFQRFCELEDAVKTSIALINSNIPVLSQEEWTICKELCTILKPFVEVTVIMSGDKYVTGSQVLIMTSGLSNVCCKLLTEPFSRTVIGVVNSLYEGLTTRFINLEYNETIALCTLLDPRFKLLAFTDQAAGEKAKKHAINLLSKSSAERHVIANADETHQEEQQVTGRDDNWSELSIWTAFDKVASSRKPSGTPLSAATIELNRYLDDDLLHRSQDPLIWWKENCYMYPALSKLVRLNFNILATSVPCERVFSKAGQVISDRRTRLSSKHLDRILFLNMNSYLFRTA